MRGAVVVDVAATPSVRRARAALLAKTGHVDAAGNDNPGGAVVAGNETAGADYESEEAALALVRGLQAGHALASLLDDGCGLVACAWMCMDGCGLVNLQMERQYDLQMQQLELSTMKLHAMSTRICDQLEEQTQ